MLNKQTIVPLLALAATCSLPLATARAAGLLIADGGFGGQLTIKEQDVRVVINNGVAVTEVTQVFVNQEDRVVEALYTFPVPKSASVSNFSMWIGGKEMTGEVVEKKRAREIYESYKVTRRDPGLLEQVDYRTFEMRVFPIAARGEQKVKVTYYQELDYDADLATYVYPLQSATRKVTTDRTTGRFSFNVDVKSEVPIESIESASHAKQFVFTKSDDAHAAGSLEVQGGELSRDVVINLKTTRPRTGVDVVANKVDGDDGYFLLTLTAGEELKEFDKPMDYVFVLDTSGSMQDANKLEIGRRAVTELTKTLRPEDRFEVLSFSAAPVPAFSSLRAADDQARVDAEKFLDARNAAGGTRLQPAMALAYRYAEAGRMLNVIVISDGMTEQSERQELISLIRQRPADTRVFCIGMGNDVDKPLLDQLAVESGGLAAFVSREDDLARQAQGFRRKLVRPVTTDLKLDFGTADVYDVEPATIPNLYHGAPVRVYGRYRKGGSTPLKLSGAVLGQPVAQEIAVDLPKSNDDNPQIERMWASKRVSGLLGSATANGGRSADKIDQIVRLGEQYSIVTEYTSFIVLENDAEYQRWKIERRNASRELRDRAARDRVEQQLAQLRDNAAMALGPAPVDPASAIKSPTRGTPMQQQPQQQPMAQNSPGQLPPQEKRRGVDLSLPDVPLGGGGAIDPISFGIVGGAIALAGLGRKRRQ